jgi:hypothetical protein
LPEQIFKSKIISMKRNLEKGDVFEMTGGSGGKRVHHSPVLGPLGFMISMGVPAVIAIIGIIVLGWDAISWGGAIAWGIVATIAFALFSMMGKKMGMTRMDLLDLLGSMFVEPGTSKSKMLGGLMHMMNGALLAIAWAYGVALLNLPANWLTGLGWGVILWMLALLMMTTMGSVHPAIKRGEQEDPGTAAMNFGKMTPMGSLMGHLVYGLVLGLLYQNWPLG